MVVVISKLITEVSFFFFSFLGFRSARSLAGSGTPPFRSYLRTARSGPSAMGFDNESSSDDEAAAPVTTKSVSQPRPIPRSVSLESTKNVAPEHEKITLVTQQHFIPIISKYCG